jgi:hypothetical protein
VRGLAKVSATPRSLGKEGLRLELQVTPLVLRSPARDCRENTPSPAKNEDREAPWGDGLVWLLSQSLAEWCGTL